MIKFVIQVLWDNQRNLPDKQPLYYFRQEFLTGTITAYCEKTREYNAPAFVALKKATDVTSTTEVNDETAEFSVFPNPVKDELTVIYTLKEAQTIHLVLFDMAGKALYTQSISGIAGHNEYTMSVNFLPPGNYLLRLSGKDISKSATIVK